MNPLGRLHEAGQRIWLNFLRRSPITRGGLERLVREDAVSGEPREGIAAVASFVVCRVDTAVDVLLPEGWPLTGPRWPRCVGGAA